MYERRKETNIFLEESIMAHMANGVLILSAEPLMMCGVGQRVSRMQVLLNLQETMLCRDLGQKNSFLRLNL